MKLLKLFSTTAILATLLFTVGCASTATQSSAGEQIDDTVITARVKTAIFNDKSLSSGAINVETFKGMVQLSGFINTSAEMETAGVVARAVPGVSSVSNNLIVK